MESVARITSKGQIAIRKRVRQALGLGPGNAVVFRVDCHRALLARAPDLLDVDGSVTVPVDKRSATWKQVRRSDRASRASTRR